MGRFNEDELDRRERTNNLELPRGENSGEETGEISCEGAREALEEFCDEIEGHDGSELETPEDISSNIDYKDIKIRAQAVYFQNRDNQWDPTEDRELEMEVKVGPDEVDDMAESLVDYLKDGGVDAMMSYTDGSLESETHWINLIGFGIIEGGNSFSNLGEYVADEVFEYSED